MWTGGQVDKWTSGQVDKWTGGQVDKWTGLRRKKVGEKQILGNKNVWIG
jgi:hypothetical protein